MFVKILLSSLGAGHEVEVENVHGGQEQRNSSG